MKVLDGVDVEAKVLAGDRVWIGFSSTKDLAIEYCDARRQHWRNSTWAGLRMFTFRSGSFELLFFVDADAVVV